MISFNWLKSLRASAGCTRVSRRSRVKSLERVASISMQLESRVLLSATASYDAITHSLNVASTESESLTISSNANQHVVVNGIVGAVWREFLTNLFRLWPKAAADLWRCDFVRLNPMPLPRR